MSSPSVGCLFYTWVVLKES
jgi:hypothetical protein